MPGMDGFELIRNARMIQPGLLIIMITGFPAEEVKCKGQQEKLDGFFSKPINWDELHTLLDTLSGSERVQNSRKGIGLYRPERILLAIILFILIIFGVQPSQAQRTNPWESNPSSKRESRGAFWQYPSFGLTEAQGKELERLQQGFVAEAIPLRRELMSLRFELRHLIRDQNVPSKTLLERQRKISELQAKLEGLSLSYQIKARSIFTKEQLEQLPQDCSLGMEVGFGMGTGISRGPRKGLH
jgi:YesN/AraC family two-component response regulator